MAKKYELITELYERTRQGVTEPAQWQRFLNTACRNYRLSFDEQLLLFAQRPALLFRGLIEHPGRDGGGLALVHGGKQRRLQLGAVGGCAV